MKIYNMKNLKQFVDVELIYITRIRRSATWKTTWLVFYYFYLGRKWNQIETQISQQRSFKVAVGVSMWGGSHQSS